MYAKIFSQMYDGSLCTEGPWEALVTFQQMLVLADMDGNVDMTANAIARRTTIPISIIEKGIEVLLKPDPHSRSPSEDGRRLMPLSEGRDWGWRVVNYKHYRQLKREEDRREYHREYWHKRKTQHNTQQTQQTQPNQPIAEAEAEAEALNALPTVVVGSAAQTRRPRCPTDVLIDLYHKRLPMLPRVEVVSEPRKRSLSARWTQVVSDPEIKKSDDPAKAGVEWFDWFFTHASRSKFLTGKAKDWRANFDFLIAPSTFAKTVEGAYHKEQT